MDCDTLVATGHEWSQVQMFWLTFKCKVGKELHNLKIPRVHELGNLFNIPHGPPWPLSMTRLWHSGLLVVTAEEKVTTSFRSSACDLEWKTLPRATQSSDFKREAKAQHPKTWSLFTCIFQKNLPAKWPLTILWSWSITQNKHLLFGAMKSDTTLSQMKENNTSNKKLA